MRENITCWQSFQLERLAILLQQNLYYDHCMILRQAAKDGNFQRAGSLVPDDYRYSVCHPNMSHRCITKVVSEKNAECQNWSG